MGFPDANEPFDTSAALAILDHMVDRQEAAVLNSVTSAWEAAWIACLTNSASWMSVAEDEFGHVVVELHGILWTVDRRRSRPASVGLGKVPQRHRSRSLTPEPFTPVLEASLARLEAGHP